MTQDNRNRCKREIYFALTPEYMQLCCYMYVQILYITYSNAHILNHKRTISNYDTANELFIWIGLPTCYHTRLFSNIEEFSTLHSAHQHFINELLFPIKDIYGGVSNFSMNKKQEACLFHCLQGRHYFVNTGHPWSRIGCCTCERPTQTLMSASQMAMHSSFRKVYLWQLGGYWSHGYWIQITLSCSTVQTQVDLEPNLALLFSYFYCAMWASFLG